jgi:hypothetical protein
MSKTSVDFVSTSVLTGTVVPRVQGAKYTVYASMDPSSDKDSYVFPSGTRGYLICEIDSKVTITTIGKAHAPVDIFSRRNFPCKISGENICLLNGIEYTTVLLPNGVGATYVRDPECFIRIDGSEVSIEFANNGFYCIDNEFLFCVKNVKLNPAIQVKQESGQKRFFEIPSTTSKIWHDGREENIGSGKTTNMFMRDSKNENLIFIDPEAKLRESLYIQHSDGSFTNIENPILAIPPVFFVNGYTLMYNLLHGYRCIPIQVPKMPTNTVSTEVSLDVTRYNNETINIKIQVYWLSKSQGDIYEVHLEMRHPDEEAIIDFSEDSIKEDFKSVNNESLGIIVFKKWHTKLICEFKNGETGEIHVYRDVLPYIEVFSPPQRYDSKSFNSVEVSKGVYMVNGKVYTQSASDNTFRSHFDGTYLTITPFKGITSFGTYDGYGNWAITRLRARVEFNEQYIYAVTTVTSGKIDIPMKIFGDYDTEDKFTYKADGSILKKPFFVLKPDQYTAPETEISRVKFTAVHDDGTEYSFLVVFVFKDFPRVSFLISDIEEFSSPYFRRTSFTGLSAFSPFWMYGPFIGELNVPIKAFGNQVLNSSSSSNIYPVITFNDSSVGTIYKTNGSLDIQAQILSEELTIPFGPNDEYVRLNACSSVQYTGSALTIPKNTSLCFFRLGSKLYLFRSPLTRSISYGSMSSSQNSPAATSSLPAQTDEQKIQSAQSANPPSAAPAETPAVTTGLLRRKNSGIVRADAVVRQNEIDRRDVFVWPPRDDTLPSQSTDGVASAALAGPIPTAISAQPTPTITRLNIAPASVVPPKDLDASRPPPSSRDLSTSVSSAIILPTSVERSSQHYSTQSIQHIRVASRPETARPLPVSLVAPPARFVASPVPAVSKVDHSVRAVVSVPAVEIRTVDIRLLRPLWTNNLHA